MAEFVYNYRLECRVMGSRKSVRIIYSSTTVSVCVCKDYDVFIWNAGELVV